METLPVKTCWYCRQAAGADSLCAECGRLQPLERDADYFRIFRLERKLSLDAAALEPKFHEFARRFHPDHYRMGLPRERLIALENASRLNQAYRTLRDPFDRSAYLLELEEGRGLDGKDSPPQELFEEILEVQELLDEYAAVGEAGGTPAFPGGVEEAGGAALRPVLEERRIALQKAQDDRARRLTGDVFAAWDRLPDGDPGGLARAEVLRSIRRILGERAYLRRVLHRLREALGEA